MQLKRASVKLHLSEATLSSLVTLVQPSTLLSLMLALGDGEKWASEAFGTVNRSRTFVNWPRLQH